MIRTTTGHPIRAFAWLMVVLLLWFVGRAPGIAADFVTMLDAARTARNGVRHAVARRAWPGSPAAPPVWSGDLAPSNIAVLPSVMVIPAKAGTPHPRPRVSPGVRRNDATRPNGARYVIATDDQPGPATTPDSVATNAATFATAGYARLAAGDRRHGARLLDAATVIGGDPRVAAWARDRDALTRRWSGSAYVVARRTGAAGVPGTPILGGSQAGATLAYTLDPLARRPVSLVVRDFAAIRGPGIDAGTAQAAIGLSWRALASLTLSAERLISPGDWSLRAAGGAATRLGDVDASAYAEAGIVGRATYAAAQARADTAVALGNGMAIHPGVGAWASVQHDTRSVGRIDAGPGVRLRAAVLPIEISVDYRFRLAGNAAPGSGLVVTLSTAF